MYEGVGEEGGSSLCIRVGDVRGETRSLERKVLRGQPLRDAGNGVGSPRRRKKRWRKGQLSKKITGKFEKKWRKGESTD